MRMITLFLPEKYLEMLDTLVATNLYPNRSEALRMATWKFLHESVSMLKVAATATATSNTKAKAKTKTSACAKKEADSEKEPEAGIAGSSELDDALNEIDAGRHLAKTGTSTSPDADPFDDIIRERQHA
jgi:Arc/MetJ-type ribon-helix-helix transcriptional regulator